MKILKTALLVNAFSSIAMGIPLLFFSGPTAQSFAVNNATVFIILGIVLLLFGTLVLLLRTRPLPNIKIVKAIIAADILWFIGSLFIILLQLFNLSSLGNTLVGAAAVWVLVMAFFQNKGIQEVDKAPYKSI